MFPRNSRRAASRGRRRLPHPSTPHPRKQKGPQRRPYHRRPESPRNNRHHSGPARAGPLLFVPGPPAPRWVTWRGRPRVRSQIWYLIGMNTSSIVAALDEEIARLQNARSFIAGSASPKRRGRPPQFKPALSAAPKRRTLSPEARKKIADAQRKRWAKEKKATVTRVPAKKAPVKRPRVKAAKAKTALSGKVPTGPVAAPAKS